MAVGRIFRIFYVSAFIIGLPPFTWYIIPPRMTSSYPDFTQIPSPCYVLDETRFRRNLAVMRRVQDEAGIKIILALKGVAMPAALPIVAEYLPGCTASSLNEARLAREFHGGEIHAYCPVYMEREFRDLSAMCTHIVFNSLTQLERWRREAPPSVSLGLRINPEFSPVKVALYNPCVPGSRLGVKAKDLAALGAPDAGSSSPLPEGVEGFHCHNLCECDTYAFEETLRRIESLFGAWLPHIKWLNLGGGHLMTREGYDVDHLISLLKAFKEKHPNLDIILEPGTAVGWRTGWLVSTVMDMFPSGDVTMLMVNISFACHAPDCLEAPYKPGILGATDAKDGKPKYRIGGCSCLSGDWMGQGDYFFETPPKVGDRVVIDDMIHYTMVKSTLFNGIAHPSIGLIDVHGSFRLLKTFGYDDYKIRL